MKKEYLTQILREHYSEPMVKAVRTNRCRPSYDKMYMFWENYSIPFQAWKDIKSWINEQEKNQELEDDDIIFLGEGEANEGEVISIIEHSSNIPT